jgi:hypothetical protein
LQKNRITLSSAHYRFTSEGIPEKTKGKENMSFETEQERQKFQKPRLTLFLRCHTKDTQEFPLIMLLRISDYCHAAAVSRFTPPPLPADGKLAASD